MKLISVINDVVAPWIRWRMGFACSNAMKAGLHVPALKAIKVSTKQPLNR